MADVKAKTGLLNTKANVGVLNKNGVANAKVSTGLLNTKANLNVLGNGQLLGLGLSIGGSGNGGGGGGNAPGPIAGMSDGQIQALQIRCYDILNSPRRFDSQLVALCQLLQKF